MPDIQTSIHGRRFGLGKNNELISNDKILLNDAHDAVIVVADSNASPRAVTVQINDSNGQPIKHCQDLVIDVLKDSGGADWATTGGSTGLAASVGKLLALVAKKRFAAKTNASGAMTLSWTDTAGETALLGITLPSGRTVISALLTTAGS